VKKIRFPYRKENNPKGKMEKGKEKRIEVILKGNLHESEN